jgi:hypothetical protein
MSSAKKTARFDEISEIRKQCIAPYTNPTFNKEQVPIIEYVGQFSTKRRNSACANQSTPFLFWSRENSKYCCSPEEERDSEFVMEKIEDAIRTQVENSCDQKLYNKYKTYIDFLIKNYIIIYKRLLLSRNRELSLAEIGQLLIQKRTELDELATYRQDGEQSASCDTGEDDEELMAQLRLAEELGPNLRGPSTFFDTEGGFSKKSKKRRNYRRSSKGRY